MNMRDIAKLAGGSSATVSNVINGSNVVRPETAARVRKVIEETRFAIGALRTLRRCGLSAPEDFSIVGFDDIDLSDIIHPPLTTLRLSRQELAQAFYDALSRFGKDSHLLGKQLSVSTSLVVRSSTGAPRSRA
jgi:DNA-binding LacI/PurR family transcriptional regulator